MEAAGRPHACAAVDLLLLQRGSELLAIGRWVEEALSPPSRAGSARTVARLLPPAACLGFGKTVSHRGEWPPRADCQAIPRPSVFPITGESARNWTSKIDVSSGNARARRELRGTAFRYVPTASRTPRPPTTRSLTTTGSQATPPSASCSRASSSDCSGVNGPIAEGRSERMGVVDRSISEVRSSCALSRRRRSYSVRPPPPAPSCLAPPAARARPE